MLAKVFSSITIGMEPFLIEVEVDVGNGLPNFIIVGLPDTSVKESKDRVRAAIKNAGYEFPARRIIVNLAPAHVRKAGPGLDLAIAIGVLQATNQLSVRNLEEYVLVGELSLAGGLRPVAGILPIALYLRKHCPKKLLISLDNGAEASLTGVSCYGFANLRQVTDFLRRPDESSRMKEQSIDKMINGFYQEAGELADVKGQQMAKRALEVTAAGGHNLLLIGPPGSGKSMLARCLPGILPLLTTEEALELTQIYSVAGLVDKNEPLIVKRPFRSPHHSTSMSSMVGGGTVPKPGEATLATHGVLFLDEMPEYRREVLEALRQPLEEQYITISRLSAACKFPARFQLVAAANPCYCGYYGDPVRECTCTARQVANYHSKFSGPLLDRIDLQVEVPRVSYKEISAEAQEETSAAVRERVVAARERQLFRLRQSGHTCNAQMFNSEVKKYCILEKDAETLLRKAYQVLGLSARARERILKVARTVADLEGSEKLLGAHVAEAIQYRIFDRQTIQC